MDSSATHVSASTTSIHVKRPELDWDGITVPHKRLKVSITARLQLVEARVNKLVAKYRRSPGLAVGVAEDGCIGGGRERFPKDELGEATKPRAKGQAGQRCKGYDDVCRTSAIRFRLFCKSE